jgi:hypothetical protein
MLVVDMKVKKIGIHAAVPLRLSMLLTDSEQKALDLLTDEFDPAVFKVVAGLEKTVQESHRIVYGIHVDGSFEYASPGKGEAGNIDALEFFRSEFPALCGEWGNVLPDDSKPVEFLMTSRFAAALLTIRKKYKLVGTHLVVRRGAMEADFFIYERKFTNVAEALLAVERGSERARRWLEPVGNEIAECNLLTVTKA